VPLPQRENGDGWGKVAKAGESWENDGNATETQLPPVLLSVAVAPGRRKNGIWSAASVSALKQFVRLNLLAHPY